MAVVQREGVFYLRRSVPKKYRDLGAETRKQVWISLHTSDQKRADQKAKEAWESLVKGWQARLEGRDGDSAKAFEAAREITEAKGYAYVEKGELLEQELTPDLVARVLAAVRRGDVPNTAEALALTGAYTKPKVKISEALERYFALKPLDLTKKDDAQRSQHENDRRSKVRAFIDFLGEDKHVGDITHKDVLDYQQWHMERIGKIALRNGHTPRTKNWWNKKITAVRSTLEYVNRREGWGLQLPFDNMQLTEDDKKRREAYTTEFIRDNFLIPGKLDRLNQECRAILLIIMNTGLRNSEAVNLTKDQIILEHDIPHIDLRTMEHRELKSAAAGRIIPLLGVALDAAREFPDGFSQYRNKKSNFTNNTNKYIRNNGLVEKGGGSTVYCLRHHFEDMMTKANFDGRQAADLMGHAINRPKYGKGQFLDLMEAKMREHVFYWPEQ